jgi:eukaryotic-like serine/threonine-protein kinase
MNQNILSSASDRYRIEREYARGGMGVTYLAIREKSGERFILKQLRLETVSDWKVVELFEREAEILRQLNHPNIPSYIDYFISESNLHFNLVQTFIEGRTMQEWIDKRLPAAADQFVLYFRQALEILEYLHALVPAVIHRDITPKNMILQNDKLFLVDFGSVKNAVNPHSARGSTVIGTYGYMPPEQYLGHTEPGSDLYSLGMSFVAFAGHKDPFELVNPELGRVEIKNELDALPVHAQSLLLDMIEPSLPKRLKSAAVAKQRLLHPELAPASVTGQALSPQDQADVIKSKAALFVLLTLFLIAGLIAWIYTVQMRHEPVSVDVQAAPTADLEIRESSAIRGYAVSHHQKWIANRIAADGR